MGAVGLQKWKCKDDKLHKFATMLKSSPNLGIGPVVFRGEKGILADHTGATDFYDNVIAPYKGQVEAWYADHQTLYMYFAVIVVTVWVVLFPSSQAVWRVFKGLPVPPAELQGALNYPVGA